jgi:GT2 family glycosyltransferase
VRHWTRGVAPSRHRGGIAVVLCTYHRPERARRLLASLALQTRPVDQLIVVDASRDAATDEIAAAMPGLPWVSYWRVTEPLRGLTRQRNFGLMHVEYDLVAYFDDDVELDRDCLRQMEQALLAQPELVGVGCFAEPWLAPTALWRLRRVLGIVPSLTPGSYTRSGMSVPWRFHAPTAEVVGGDWLPGCAMMLKTEAAAKVRFDEALGGYGQAEDLDFSLRLRAEGRLAMAGAARCEHAHAPEGRPDAFRIGQMEIAHRHRIWRRVHDRPGLSGRLLFAYAWTLDTVLLLRDAVRPGRAVDGIRRIAGRLAGASQIMARRFES